MGSKLISYPALAHIWGIRAQKEAAQVAKDAARAVSELSNGVGTPTGCVELQFGLLSLSHLDQASFLFDDMTN